MSNLKNTRLGRAETLDNLMGRDGPGREKLKMSWAGQDHGQSPEHFDAPVRTAANPLKLRGAGPGPRPTFSKFDEPGRAAAREV